MCSFCGDGWRFETVILGGPNAGQVTNVLHPVSAEWEEGYSRPSTGSLVLAARDPSAEDVWPDTGIYISQVMPDGTRRCRFGGFFPKNNGAGGGALSVAIESIDAYLNLRLLLGPGAPYSVTQQAAPLFPSGFGYQYVVRKPTAMGVETTVLTSGIYLAAISALPVFLVKFAQGNIEGEGFTGVPILDAEIGQPSQVVTVPVPWRQRWWDIKSVGQIIREQVEDEDGPKYQLEHTYANGYWSTVMVFADTVGEERDYTLKSDREGWQYALEVDGADRASRVIGVGSGEEWNTMYSIAYDAGRDPDYPERQVTVAWKDQIEPTILDTQTKGYVSDHRDPTTIPSMTVVGMPDYDSDAAGFDPQKGFPAPEICRPGDTFGVDIGYGAITVKDIRVKNLGVAWSLKEGAPVERTIAMQPVERPSVSVRLQTPSKPPASVLPVTQTETVTSDPWPTPGKVTNIFAPALDEVSGMEASRANPGFVWVHNDETETKQVHLVSLKTGGRAATFGLNPGVSAAPTGDPEAIRLSKVTGKLVLADTGDNALNRPTSGANQPHLLAVTEPKGGGDKGALPATKYPIGYPNGERVNCETLLIHPTTDVVYLVSKETNRSRVFSYGPLSAMSTVNNVGTLVATLNVAPYLVADGTHSWNGKFVFFRVQGNTATIVYDAVSWKKLGFINAPPMAKSEAICVPDSCSFLTTTEGLNPPIYRVLIPTTFGATCSTPAGGSGTGGTTPPTTATVPGQLIPMNNWKLQLPI